MGRLFSAADVERVAAQGQREVAVDADAILTPLARDRARDLGVVIRRGASRPPASAGTGLEHAVRRALEDTLQRIGDDDLGEVIRQTVLRLRTSAPVTGPVPARPVGPILEGRVALVTGASSGIGAAVAVALAEAGARVLVGSFAGDPHDPEQTRARIEAAGGQCLIVQADVTSSAQLEQACARATNEWGRLDVVVANAAILRRDPLAELSDEAWAAVLDVDLGGVLRTWRAAAGRMGIGGALIGVSSIAGAVFGWAEHSHYAAAKAGIVGLVRSLAAELGPRGIRVNAVLPGLIETPQSLDPHASVGAEGLRAASGSVPLRRIGTAEEVARAVRFLASDEATYITGHALVVDGGVSTSLAL